MRLWQQKIIMFILIFVMIGVVVYRIFIYHPIVQYVDVERNTIERIVGQTEAYQQDDEELHKRLAQEPHTQEIIVSGNVDLNEFSQTAMLARGILANSRLIIHSQSNPATMETSAQVNVQLQRTSLLKANYYQNHTYTALKLPFYHQAIGIKNDRLGQWLNRNGYETVMSDVPQTVDLQQKMSFSLEDYIDLLGDVVQYETKVEENVDYKGETFQRFSLKMSENQVNEFIQNLISFVSENEQESSMTYKYLSKLDELSFPNGLIYKAYYTDESVAYRELSGQVKHNNSRNDFVLNVETQLDEDVYSLNAELLVKGKQPLELIYQSRGQPAQENYSVNRSVLINQKNLEQIRLQWDTLYQDQEEKINFQLHWPSLLPTIEGELVRETNINSNQGQQSYDWSINVNQWQVAWGIERSIDFKESVELNKISAQDVLYLHKLTEGENRQLIQNIKKSAQDYIEQLIKQFNPFN